MIKHLGMAAFAAALLALTAASPVMAQAKKTGAAKSQPSAGQLAVRERQKKCGAEWKEAKAAGKIEKGMKWPQYWSACNKRLKGAP
jgi:hypothetical protein